MEAQTQSRGIKFNVQSQIKFSVDGTKFETTMDVICSKYGGPNTFFTQMFATKGSRLPAQQDQDGAFILQEVDSGSFRRILEFLKTGVVSNLAVLSNRERCELRKVSDFFGIEPLLTVLPEREIDRRDIKYMNKWFKTPLRLVRAHLPEINLSGLQFGDFSNFGGCNLVYSDFSNSTVPKCMMKNVDLSCAILTGSNFSGSNFDGGCFVRADLSNSDFSNCQMKNCNFTNTKLRNVNFNGSDLTGSIFNGSQISGANFSECIVDKIDFQLISEKDISNTNFSNLKLPSSKPFKFECSFSDIMMKGTNFSGVHFNQIDFEKIDFIGNSFLGTTFERCNLSSCVLNENLSGSTFIHCRFQNSSLENSKEKKLSFIDCNLDGSNFSKKDLSGWNFSSCSMKNCDFQKSILGNFERTEFDGSNFRGVILRNIRMTRCKLLRCCCQCVYFDQVDLSESIFLNSNLKNSKFNCSEGKNPILFENSDLVRAHFVQSDLTDSKFIDVDFTDSFMECCYFANTEMRKTKVKNVDATNLSQIIFSGVDLKEMELPKNMKGSALIGTDLSNLDLSGIDFSNSTLSNSNFSNSNLSGANLSNCDCSGTNFSNVFFSTDFCGANLMGGRFRNSTGRIRLDTCDNPRYHGYYKTDKARFFDVVNGYAACETCGKNYLLGAENKLGMS